MSAENKLGETPPMPDMDALKASQKKASSGNISIGNFTINQSSTAAEGEDVAAVVKKEQSDSGHSS